MNMASTNASNLMGAVNTGDSEYTKEEREIVPHHLFDFVGLQDFPDAIRSGVEEILHNKISKL